MYSIVVWREYWLHTRYYKSWSFVNTESWRTRSLWRTNLQTISYRYLWSSFWKKHKQKSSQTKSNSKRKRHL